MAAFFRSILKTKSYMDSSGDTRSELLLWKKALRGKYIFKSSAGTFYFTLYNHDHVVSERVQEGLVNIKAPILEMLVAKRLDNGSLTMSKYYGKDMDAEFVCAVEDSTDPLPVPSKFESNSVKLVLKNTVSKSSGERKVLQKFSQLCQKNPKT